MLRRRYYLIYIKSKFQQNVEKKQEESRYSPNLSRQILSKNSKKKYEDNRVLYCLLHSLELQ